jgi:hypothetical protein
LYPALREISHELAHELGGCAGVDLPWHRN